MKKITEQGKLTIQVLIACALIVAGLALLFMGFFAVPLGEISASVLTAFGETATFSGGLLGIDYTYKFRVYKIDREYPHKHFDREIIEEEKEVDE